MHHKLQCPWSTLSVCALPLGFKRGGCQHLLSLSRIGCILSPAILAAALRRLQDTSHWPHPVGPSHSRVANLFILQHPGLKLGCEEFGMFTKGYWHSYTQFGRNPERQTTGLKFSTNHPLTRLIRENSKQIWLILPGIVTLVFRMIL